MSSPVGVVSKGLVVVAAWTRYEIFAPSVDGRHRSRRPPPPDDCQPHHAHAHAATEPRDCFFRGKRLVLRPRSIRIEAVATDKLFKVEEPKESQAATASQGRRPPSAACDSFGSSTLKSLSVATASILMDLAFDAGVMGSGKRFESRALDTAIAHDYRTDL